MQFLNFRNRQSTCTYTGLLGGKDVIRVVFFFFKNTTNICCNNTLKSYRCQLSVFKWILLKIKLMLPTIIEYREYGDVRVFSKNYITCFILVIVRNIGDISIKWFIGKKETGAKNQIRNDSFFSFPCLFSSREEFSPFCLPSNF